MKFTTLTDSTAPLVIYPLCTVNSKSRHLLFECGSKKKSKCCNKYKKKGKFCKSCPKV